MKTGAMKIGFAVMATLLLGAAVRGQAPASLPDKNRTAPQGAVAISDEPHHRPVLQNDFAHVYNVAVPPLDATLLHQHDLPYLYVVLGPADIINAIQGKPELHQVLQDGEVHYSPGKFAHIARTDSGVAFHNITIELARPQGTAKNICKEVIAGPLDCKPEPPANGAEGNATGGGAMDRSEPGGTGGSKAGYKGRKKKTATRKIPKEAPRDVVAYFETDEARVDLYKVSSGSDYVDVAPQNHGLLIALTDSNLDVNLGGEHISFLHSGDVLWLPAGKHRRVVDFLGTHSGFLLITFKDGTAAPATQ